MLLIQKFIILNNLTLIIESPESDYLYIKTSQLPNAGKGLFTAIEIYKHEVISIFKGEILSEIEAKNRVKNKTDKFFINMIDGTIMDSMNIECFAKYANDAAAYENAEFKNNSKITLDDNQNVCIVATKNLKSNNEIFCSYGKKYWEKHI